MQKTIFIALAGLVGTLLRYWLSSFMARQYGETFPWGTMAVNLIGCFVTGVVFFLTEERLFLTPTVRTVILNGLLGGFTTFSAYGLQTFTLLHDGEFVLVNKLAYKAHDVNHGDLIVFERPPEAAQAGQEDIKDLIKRVIAVGGDTVESRNGLVYVNGERIEEPYLVEGTPTERLPLTPVPEGEVFVMGDNRTNSEDSRDFGPIDEDTIVGRAVVKVLPLSDIGWL